MKTHLEYESAVDPRLVELCLHGNRDAFAQIVARYQSVVCAIAYSACGDIGRSEDLAQETFVTAWRKLGELREPEKLKSWLCGIARNLVQNSVRQQQRVPTAHAEELSLETSSGTANPQEMAISNEEEALMWRALETIAPDYREPMVLFYREGQSVEKVAAALDLSEEAARQRLSRGRVMLNERMTKTVERALFRSAPGKVFTLAVLVALPAFAVSASAATTGSAMAKGSAGAKVAAASMGLAGVLFPPLLAFFGTYIGYKLSLETAYSPKSRAFVLRFYRILTACVAVFGLAIWLFAKEGAPLAKSHPPIFAGVLIALTIGYVFAILALTGWARKTRRNWALAEMNDPLAAAKSRAQSSERVLEYRSKFTLLGLPLIHLRFGGGEAQKKTVKAWFAGGDRALGGIFAFGGLAIAPISLGGIGIGLVSLSGMGVGVLCFSGFSLGIWVVGGAAIGWLAYGGCAIAWQGAVGGVALARDYAVGGIAIAGHANDATADATARSTQFFPLADTLMNHAIFLNLAWMIPLFFVWLAMRGKRNRGAGD